MLGAYPAAYDNVIGVTGVLENDRKGRDTGYGAYVDVAAPVDDVPTVAYNADYATDGDPTTDPHIPLGPLEEQRLLYRPLK